jgi:putative transposase
MNHTSPHPTFFDRAAEVTVTHGRDLPHWSQAAVVTFITWRTWDSLPADVVTGWLDARDGWLRRHNIDPTGDVTEAVRRLEPAARVEFRELLSARWESSLDTAHGSCPFRDAANAVVVGHSLRHFDGVRYTLFDFVVMPNHVHLLVAFTAVGMAAQCESWKHFTAVRLNQRLGRTGRFWHAESFDHLVRSEEDFMRYRQYIADNPKKAGLKAGEYLHYSRPFG